MNKERVALAAALIGLCGSFVTCVGERFAAWEAREMYELTRADYELKAASAETCWTEFAREGERNE